jgi:hypothetical protein
VLRWGLLLPLALLATASRLFTSARLLFSVTWLACFAALWAMGAATEMGGCTVQKFDHQIFEDLFASGLGSPLALRVLDCAHPREVVQDDRLGPTEKRSILSTWASDACAVESRPGFRWLPGTPGPILVDQVLAALRTLDEITGLRTAADDVVARRPARYTPRGHPLSQSPRRGSAGIVNR